MEEKVGCELIGFFLSALQCLRLRPTPRKLSKFSFLCFFFQVSKGALNKENEYNEKKPKNPSNGLSYFYESQHFSKLLQKP